MEETEIIKARSERKAVERLLSLYPNLVDYDLLFRRDAKGRFSRHGQTFLFRIELIPDEPAPEDLGEDEFES